MARGATSHLFENQKKGDREYALQGILNVTL